MSEQDPYAVLGVPPNATAEEIRKAYISRCKVLHPDRFDAKTQPKEWAQANEMHAELNRAYATLRNANQRSSSGAQANGAEAAQEQAASATSTPDTPPAPHQPKRPFIDGRLIFMLFIAGFWVLYMGATSLWREAGIDKVPHHLSLMELQDGTVPNNRSLRISDAECDVGHGVAYLEKYTPKAYYIPLVRLSGRLESEAPPSGRKIILRLTKELYDAHSGSLQNVGAPPTVEGIRLLNTDIESRIEEFLKKELGIAKLDKVVVIDGGRQPIGFLVPFVILIIYSAFLLGLFFTFVKKQKRAWSTVAIVCGWVAMAPSFIFLEPSYKSPLASQGTNSTAIKNRSESKADASAPAGKDAVHTAESQTSPATDDAAQSVTNPEVAKLREAAEQGDPSAQYLFGFEFFRGFRVPQDNAESAVWFRKAAEAGNADAQLALAYLYSTGRAVPPNGFDEAYWGLKAKDQGNIDARWVKLLSIPAEQGDIAAIRTLAFTYLAGGEGVPKNIDKAVEWFRQGAGRGDIESQLRLGRIYDLNLHNAEEAVIWYRKAAERGDDNAQYYLGYCYGIGKGVLKDEIEALAWFNIAAQHSHNYPSVRQTQREYEQRLGQQISLLAQKRSKEILKRIQAAKANKAQAPKSEQ